MNEAYRFELPRLAREVTPVLRLRGPVEKRQEVLLFSTPDDPEFFAETPSFAWSDSLGSHFRYAPETRGPGIVPTASFDLSSSIRELHIAVVARRGDEGSVIADIVLSATIGGAAAEILAEKG